VFLAWLIGSVQQPGYTPVMITLAGSTSALLLGLGVVGSYVWRTYENGKGRPAALTADQEVFERRGRNGSGITVSDRAGGAA
jgi:polyisoprenyl-phosphate glycosyltransferase